MTIGRMDIFRLLIQGPLVKTGGGAFRRWRDYHWSVVGMLAVVCFLLGMAGWNSYADRSDQMLTFWDILYASLRLFTMEHGGVSGSLPWQLQLARFLAPAVVMYTVIRASLVVFRDQIQLFRRRFLHDHIVVCGLGDKGYSLATELIRSGSRVVAIELDRSNGRIEQAREQGVVVLVGNAADTERLRAARVGVARYVFSVCGEDGANAEIAVHCLELYRAGPRRGLTCFSHVADPDLSDYLNECKMSQAGSDGFHLELFNLHESGARALLSTFPPFIDTHCSEDIPCVVVVGLGRLGRSFVLEAARCWGMIRNQSNVPLPILLIDPRASAVQTCLEERFPALTSLCTLTSRDLGFEDAECIEGRFLRAMKGKTVTNHLYICLSDEAKGFTLALGLRERFYPSQVSVVVRTRHYTGLGRLVAGKGTLDGGEKQIGVFPLYDRTCTADLLVRGTYETIARAMHEDYIRNQLAHGQTLATNPSMAPWDELPETLKHSNRAQAEHIRVKLDAVDCGIRLLRGWDTTLFEFTAQEVERLGRMEHDRWVKERREDGWTYAPGEKNIEKKTSPYLAGWDDLPEAIREYDREFVRGLPAFLAKAGFEIYRKHGQNRQKAE